MRLIALLLLAVSLYAPNGLAQQRPLIVTSIKPLAVLVAELAGDRARIEVLVPANADPHHFQLTPSGRALLEEADLIVWVGPSLENFLQRLLGTPGLAPQVLTLEETTDGREGASDPHLWLDPAQVPDLARALAERLGSLPASTGIPVADNLERFLQRWNQSLRELRARLNLLEPVAFFSYHDAFQRFLAGFGLSLAGVATPQAERQPGARHLARLQASLRASPSACILLEPPGRRQWWLSLADDRPTPMVTLDPLAREAPVQPGAYLAYFSAMAETLLKCRPATTAPAEG